jgi:hypothetical protein
VSLSPGANTIYVRSQDRAGNYSTNASVNVSYTQVQFSFVTNNGTITITAYTGPGGAVAVPSTILGLPVTSIGKAAFLFASFTSVTIPGSVTSIEDDAFDYCASLITVMIPNGVASIGGFAFAHCTSLANVTIPGTVTNIGDYAFSGCSSLKGVYFKGDAPSLGSGVFDDNSNGTVYYLPWTAGWGLWPCNLPAVLWNPQVQTGDASFGLQTNRFGFNITGSSNLVVVVEACTNLANPAWFPVGTNTLTGASSYFSDPKWTNYPAGFYRLRSP